MKTKNKTLSCVLLVAAALLCPAFGADSSYSFPSKGRFIFPASAAHGIFEQCSRSTPSPKAGTWIPTETEIQELESLLPKYLEQKEGLDHGVPPKGTYHRQYAGFIRNGERYIYGNFYSPDRLVTSYEAKHAVQVCDGGPSFWGVVYRIKTKTFEDIQFNGVA